MTPDRQLATFLSKYTPEMSALATTILKKMRARLPGAVELVYDNYNALVIGFGPAEKASDAPFSIAVYPRWVNLFFLRGATLPDPHKLLQGDGKIVRSITLKTVDPLEDPHVQELIAKALAQCDPPMPLKGKGRTVIKSISEKQRPRTPR